MAGEAAREAALPAGLAGRAALGTLLRGRNLRLRLVGGTISVLGDQMYLVALPWLVLQTTGDAFAVGAVLALAAVPRAVFMVPGGAFTDRFSSRLVMFISNVLRGLLVGLVATAVLLGQTHLWLLYAQALAFGLVDGFFYPASSAVMPQILEPEQLQSGNAVTQGAAQAASFVGPVLAGAVIATCEAGGGSASLGSAIALLATGLCFLASALLLRLLRPRRASGVAAQGNVLQSVRESLLYAWRDEALRTVLPLMSVFTLLMYGPIAVGVPVLADTRFPERAAAFGLIMSAWGGGAVLGSALALFLPRPRAAWTGPLVLALAAVPGPGLVLLGLTYSTLVAALDGLVIGAAAGYLAVLFLTWLQLRTPEALLGRVMGLMLFGSVGLTPVSLALAGALIAVDVTLLFLGAGVLLVLVVALAALSPTVRSLGREMSTT